MNLAQKFGIRGRMFFAFGVIASVTIVTSVIAWIAYERLGNSVQQIARNDITAVSLAAELAAKGGAITATAPSLVAAVSESERRRDWDALAGILRKMEALVERIYAGEAQAREHALKTRLLNAVASNLRELDAVVRQRFWFADRNRELSDRLRWAHADLLDEVDPMIDDARFNIGLGLEKTGPGGRQPGGDLKAEVAHQEALLRIKAAG
ncbi:MAG TPA: histidine kinase, partial [Rhizobiales bacterium]|nr:histidine kinase [Hyphomicrobiales bacterium]